MFELFVWINLLGRGTWVDPITELTLAIIMAQGISTINNKTKYSKKDLFDMPWAPEA